MKQKMNNKNFFGSLKGFFMVASAFLGLVVVGYSTTSYADCRARVVCAHDNDSVTCQERSTCTQDPSQAAQEVFTREIRNLESVEFLSDGQIVSSFYACSFKYDDTWNFGYDPEIANSLEKDLIANFVMTLTMLNEGDFPSEQALGIFESLVQNTAKKDVYSCTGIVLDGTEHVESLVTQMDPIFQDALKTYQQTLKSNPNILSAIMKSNADAVRNYIINNFKS
jgi:hypothetical protein